MKKFTYLLAALMICGSASAAKVHRSIARPSAPAMAIMEQAVENNAQANVAAGRPTVSDNVETIKFELVPTGKYIGEKVEFGSQFSQYQALANSQVIVEEHFENFTEGSQSSPYGPLNDDHGNIPSKWHPNSPNLYGWGVYSCGGWAMLRAGYSGAGAAAYPEFRIANIDLTGDLTDIQIVVAALSSGCQLEFDIIDATQNAVQTKGEPVAVPYDGQFYTLVTSKNAVKNFTNAQLMVYESNNKDLAIGGFYIAGKLRSGSGNGNGNGNGNGGGYIDTSSKNTTNVGKPGSLSHSIGRTKQNFTINWTKANNATSHEVKVYNDVCSETDIPSLRVLNMDYSGVKGGSNDPYNPNSTVWKTPNLYLDAMPGGVVHNLVLLNGAIGFCNIPSFNDQYFEIPGFETDIYDLSATNGVATLKFDYYATIGCGIVIWELAWNEDQNDWIIADSAELDEESGLMIESDEDSPWDYLEITLDTLPAGCTGEVYFVVGVYSVIAATDDYVEDPENAPVFFYISSLSLTMNNIPAYTPFYYTYLDNPAVTGTSLTVNGDVANNYYNYIIRGINSNDLGLAWGDWVGDPATGDAMYVRPLPNWVTDPTDPHYPGAVEGIEADKLLGPATYYNLQGIRVENPVEGQLYIVKQGNKTIKTVVR